MVKTLLKIKRAVYFWLDFTKGKRKKTLESILFFNTILRKHTANPVALVSADPLLYTL